MSFNTAVSGIKVSTADLSIIGNNVANSSTVGFKRSRGDFADVYASGSLGVGSEAVGKGVRLVSVAQQFTQGNINFTDNELDMAISGNGFFVLSDNGSPVYTRAGNFSLDNTGYLVNQEGFRVSAFQADGLGGITGGVGDLQVTTSLIDPAATTAANINLNLDSREAAPATAWGGPYDAFAAPPTAPLGEMYNGTSTMNVYDSLGNAHLLSNFYVKTAVPNQWDVHTMIDGVTADGGTPNTLTFDASGQFPSAALPVQLNIAGWTPLDSLGAANGAAVQGFSIDMSPTTQFAAGLSVLSVSQDGFASGQLSGLNVADNGVLFGDFTNGQALALGQLAMADFPNSEGLQPLGNTTWGETFASGQPVVGEAGTGGMGVLQSGALEDSNVELTEQLVDMIVAQRNFQANAQVIQTLDDVTQSIINLR